jgi:hypothetical protein
MPEAPIYSAIQLERIASALYGAERLNGDPELSEAPAPIRDHYFNLARHAIAAVREHRSGSSPVST